LAVRAAEPLHGRMAAIHDSRAQAVGDRNKE
jgi:hypothetical protein